jgi:N-methylhydantoinase B
LAIIADRFATTPWGLNGGSLGKPGRVYIKKRDGGLIELDSKTAENLEPGD